MTYLENSSLEFSSDIQNNSFNKTLLMFKIRCSTNSYDVDTVSDKTDLSITPFKIGNKRITLNSELDYSAF
jgi:hypothetical protein